MSIAAILLLNQTINSSYRSGGGGGGWGKQRDTADLDLPKLDGYTWALYERGEDNVKPLVLVLRKDSYTSIGIEYTRARKSSIQAAARKIMHTLNQYKSLNIDTRTFPQVKGWTWEISERNMDIWHRVIVRLTDGGIYNDYSCDARINRRSILKAAQQIVKDKANIDGLLGNLDALHLPLLPNGQPVRVTRSSIGTQLRVGVDDNAYSDFVLAHPTPAAIRSAARQIVRRAKNIVIK